MYMACDDCRYFVRISEGVWQGMYSAGKLPKSASLDKRMNFCAMAARFIRSAIFVCSIKEGKDGQIDLSSFDEKDKEWMPLDIINS